MTRQQSSFPEGVDAIHTIDAVLERNEERPDEELFVIGGANIFRQFLPHADRMYITLIDEAFTGDTYFPAFAEDNWQLTVKEKGVQNEKTLMIITSFNMTGCNGEVKACKSAESFSQAGNRPVWGQTNRYCQLRQRHPSHMCR